MKILSPILKIGILLVFLLGFCHTASSQDRRYRVSLSNNTTGLPVLGYPALFYSQFHPGLDGAMSWQLNKSDKNRIYANANIGIYHHRFVQTLVRVYPTISYTRAIAERFAVTAGLGGGYGLSFEGKNAFILQSNGTYKQKGFMGARSQFLVGLELGVSYALFSDNPNGPQLHLQFCSHMQGIYVNSYVPLLPINIIQIGASFKINQK